MFIVYLDTFNNIQLSLSACILYFSLSTFFLKEKTSSHIYIKNIHIKNIYIKNIYIPQLSVHYQACSSLLVIHVFLHWHYAKGTCVCSGLNYKLAK